MCPGTKHLNFLSLRFLISKVGMIIPTLSFKAANGNIKDTCKDLYKYIIDGCFFFITEDNSLSLKYFLFSFGTL